MHGLMSYRRFERARSLRSDRAERTLGRCVATELRLGLGRYVATNLQLELGRYVATERNRRSVATAEIDQIVEGIYRALEFTEERLEERCDDIYFPMDLSINALTSKIDAIQGELVEIQSYIARRPEASPLIDRRNNKSTNIHQQISVDKASNRGTLIQKITSDRSDTHNHGEEISADTYTRLMRHQFNLESLGDRLQKIEDATTIMKDKWRRGDESIRDFTDSTKDTKVDQPVNYVILAEIV
ncbi:hypothetical protein F2Q69_00013870 [Brassica cretica]|uniref:Uncharacterized protein n=1 Tax=Brassica cretica TaxID=69181 RepID=A0A8S9QU59_BRACR|nr:hypothetical protein F2Q69_00013870 [Brassica cretica]